VVYEMPKQAKASPTTNPKLKQLQALASSVRTGGKGSVRRKTKIVNAASGNDEKKLQAFIQQQNCRPVPDIDRVDLIRIDTQTMKFINPKGFCFKALKNILCLVFININSNLTVIQGKHELACMFFYFYVYNCFYSCHRFNKSISESIRCKS
jgi:hypothetical protein